MKKKLFLLALATAAISLQSCDKDDDILRVPDAVASSFSTKYPNATRVSWEYEQGYLVADFHYNNYEAEAWFDKNGKWYLTETDVPFTALPQEVKDAFGKSAYATWKVEDVDKVEKVNEELFYVIEVESGKQELDLYYDVNGTLTQELPDTDKEHEYLP